MATEEEKANLRRALDAATPEDRAQMIAFFGSDAAPPADTRPAVAWGSPESLGGQSGQDAIRGALAAPIGNAYGPAHAFAVPGQHVPNVITGGEPPVPAGAVPGPVDTTPSIGQIMQIGGRGSPGGFRHMEAAPVGEAYGNAFAAGEQATQHETEANKDAAQAEGDAARSRAGVIMGAREEAAKAEERRAKVLQDHAAQSAKLAQDVRDTDMDPDSYYGQGAGGVLKRGLLLIATSLGGYSAGLRGGPNTVQDSIDKDIDRFVAGQKSEYAKRQGLLQQSNSRFGQLMQQFGDERAAESALKADMYGAVEAQGQGIIADAKGGQIDAAGEKTLAGISLQKAQHLDDRTKYIAPTAGMSPLQAAEWKLKMQQGEQGLRKGEADIEKTTAEAEHARAGGTEKKPDMAASVGRNLEQLSPRVLSSSTAMVGGVGIRDPRALLQGTEAHSREQIQKEWNAQILSSIPARSLDVKKTIGESYLIQPSDTAETIKEKVAAALRNLPGVAAAAAGEGTTEPAKPPASFKEE